VTRGASLLRYGLILAVPALLAVSVLSASPASAATSARAGEPRHVTAVAGNNSAIVRFLPPSSNGGYRVNRYDILTETTGTKQVYTCTATDCRVGGLTAGTLYFFQVAAVTKIGRGAYSLPSKVVTVTGSVAITFNANGGTGTMAPETEQYDTTAALTPNAFTYVGYTFAGWNTKANGSGTAFTDGALAKFNGNATFYAQWTVGSATTATITFNANGGTGTMAPETESVATALSLNTFSRTGYTFNDWNTTSNGSGTSYENGATYAFATSVTLYAQWTAMSPTGTFTGTTTPNWSGYVLPSNTAIFTGAAGEWTVPTLNCADTPNANSSTWVGIGGYGWSTGGSSGVLLQTGTEDDCVNGVQEDSGWWEEYPSDPNYSRNFINFPVAPGDVMDATVFQTSSGAWETLLNNLTTGLSGIMITGEAWGVQETGASSFTNQGTTTGLTYSGGYTAEWITEDTGGANSNSYYPFANFQSVTFSDLQVSLPSGWALPNSDGVAMVQQGVTLSVPSGINGGGGFTITYTGP